MELIVPAYHTVADELERRGRWGESETRLDTRVKAIEYSNVCATYEITEFIIQRHRGLRREGARTPCLPLCARDEDDGMTPYVDAERKCTAALQSSVDQKRLRAADRWG